MFSIILPTYNRKCKLAKAIKSIINQTYYDWELIIIDDGSTDGTFEILSRIDDDRVSHYRLEQNAGVSYARNYGITHTKGEYIAFLDDDDEWEKHKLENDYNQLIGLSDEYAGICSQMIRKNKDSKMKYPSLRYQYDISTEQLLLRNLIPLPTAVIKREAFIKTEGFDCNLGRKVDWELVINISQQYKIKYIPYISVISHVTDNSINCFNLGRDAEALDYILSKHLVLYLSHRSIYMKMIVYICTLYAVSGNKWKVREYLRKIISNRIFQPSMLILIPSIMTGRLFSELYMLRREIIGLFKEYEI